MSSMSGERTHCVQAIAARVEHLISMLDGWKDGEGLAPTMAAIHTAERVALAFAEGGMRTRMYPALDGGVCLEWSPPGYEISLDVLPDGQFGPFESVDVPNPEQP